MKRKHQTSVFVLGFLLCHSWVMVSMVQAQDAARKSKIVLVAGETAKVDAIGHHDYLAGCQCMVELLQQTNGVTVQRVNDGWPVDETVFDDCSSVVFYTDGGGKQAFLSSPSRVAKLTAMMDRGVGVVMIHQAVDFPDEMGDTGKDLLGGVFVPSKSSRGHWDSAHVDFPSHPITRGVVPWKINDGWLNAIDFVDGMKGVTPLVWSGKEYQGSRAGLEKDIVAWSYDRPKGGKAFSFTGLDAHSAWSLPGMRQLMINGVLWSAGFDIPSHGASCEISDEKLDAMQTPRTPKPKPAKAKS
jgi:hypothetical protein